MNLKDFLDSCKKKIMTILFFQEYMVLENLSLLMIFLIKSIQINI